MQTCVEGASPSNMNKKDSYYEALTKALKKPELYKVCSICGCIVSADEGEYSYCSAYRFNTETEAVSNAALDQLTRSFDNVTNPTSSAYD